MNRWIAGSAVTGSMLFVAPVAAAAPPDPVPPGPVQFEVIISANAATGGCDFDVLLQYDGHGATLPSGGTILIAPNSKATVTNVSEGSAGFGKTAVYSVNGAFMNNEDAQGNVVTKATGRNFLTDPNAGIVVTSGNFSFTTGPDGSNVVPLHGTGNMIDVCAALS